MSTTYQPVEASFQEELQALADKRTHVRLQYYSDINEFLTVHAAITNLLQKGEEAYLQLSSGEEIRLDRIVRIGDKPAPGYDQDYFKCDC